MTLGQYDINKIIHEKILDIRLNICKLDNYADVATNYNNLAIIYSR